MVGEYQVLEPVGEGGMGVVYRGIQPVIKKRVAIKVLKPQVAGDEQQVQRLVAEAESVNAIGHRGIIDIFGLGALPDGRPYIIMEFLEGEALDLWLSRQPGGRVPLLTALELLLEICAPLAAAHRANVIHRDLKPSNVFVCRQTDGTRFLKLLDFGLAKRAVGLDGSTKQTSQGTVSGTPDYMAPEQARALPISTRSDIYALGVVAYELFTGRVPFSGATPMDVMVAHVSQLPAPLREVAPELPEALETLVMRMLAKAPEVRPQTVDEVRNALEDVVMWLGNPRPRSSREHPVFVPRTASSSPQLPTIEVSPVPLAENSSVESSGVRRVERKKTSVAVVAMLALGVTAAGVVWFLTRPEPVAPSPPPPVVVTRVAEAPTPPVNAVVPPQAEPVDAGAEPVDAGVPFELDLAEEPLPVRKVKPVAVAPATQKQLKDRIARLELRAKKQASLDPTALQFLARYRIDATVADTPVKRSRVERALNEWERSFLKK